MVDSVKGAGSVTGITPSGKTQSAGHKRAEPSEEAVAVVDDVQISEEALSLANAQQSTQAARAELEKNPALTLTDNVDFEGLL